MTDYDWERHIALLAYYKWEAAGRPDGENERFWYEAIEEYSEIMRTQGTNGPHPSMGD